MRVKQALAVDHDALIGLMLHGAVHRLAESNVEGFGSRPTVRRVGDRDGNPLCEVVAVWHHEVDLHHEKGECYLAPTARGCLS